LMLLPKSLGIGVWQRCESVPRKSALNSKLKRRRNKESKSRFAVRLHRLPAPLAVTEKRIHILIVDDHPVVLKGLAATLTQEADMEVVASAATGPQAVSFYRDLRPDITIMDIALTPEMTGIEATLAIRRDFPQARIIMLSAHKESEDIYQALKAGAITFLPKETLGDDLVPVIREVHAGGKPIPAEIARKLADRMFQSHLTARETEVLRLVAEGLRNKEIAERLSITENTVQGHVKSIRAKFKVNDRSGAIAEAVRRGVLHITE
jgi:DNA-binding NarL/FixJ family response regulator